MTLLLPYRVQSPPVTFTSTSAKKITFTQTRVHKYLSERTQMDDIFQGSSLYATSQLKLLHEDKERQLLLLAFGGAGRNPPQPTLLRKELGYVIKTHTEAVQVKRAAGLLQWEVIQTNQGMFLRSRTWLVKEETSSQQHLQARLGSDYLFLIICQVPWDLQL